MLKTTLGQLLVNDALPKDLQDYTRTMDKKNSGKLFQEIAARYPEQYREIAKKLSDIGRKGSTESGGMSFGLDSMITPDSIKKLRMDLQVQINKVLADRTLDSKSRQEKVIALTSSRAKEIQDTLYDESVKNKNPLAIQVLSGARGNPGNLRSVLAGDLLYEDHSNRIIPIPILHSYSEGLSPAEYWAGTYGARKGIVDTKLCLAGDTKVLLSDYAVKTIDKIVVGDEVLTLDDAHKLIPTKVVRVFNNGLRTCWQYKFKAAESELSVDIVATPEHKIYVINDDRTFRMKKLRDLDATKVVSVYGYPKKYDKIAGRYGYAQQYVADKPDTSVFAHYIGDMLTYDIEVEHPSHLFVLENGLVVSNSTAKAGYFGKQLNQATHRLVIHSLDDKNYTGTIRGVPMPTDDPDNEGAFLAQDVGGFKRNTQLTPKILAELSAKGNDKILIRSPLVGGHPDGGLYAYDVGVRERGGLSAPGDNVGMAAAQALAEQATQAQISSRHQGGVAGAGGAVSGFKYIDQLIQVPKTFTGGATHSDTDGKVSAVYDAPAGGKYAMINGVRHFIHAGQTPNIKSGDIVEAGDVISSGLPNPSKIVEHKGVGEGRRYFVDVMRKVYQDSGLKAHRRNVELLSRGLINHVELDDEIGDFVPGDKVSYDVIEHNYQPRADHSVTPVKSSIGQYLEKPILHYTIGTKLQPSMIREMERFGVKNVMTHKEPPPFRPVMIQGRYNLLHDPDWMTRQLGMDLKKGLLDSAHRGLTSDTTGTSFVGGLANAKDFGRVGLTKSWDPKKVIKTQIIRPEQDEFGD